VSTLLSDGPTSAHPATTGRRVLWRPVVAVLGVAALVLPLGWMWQDSRLPGTYSVMDMGHVDLGGGPSLVQLASGHHDHGDTSVADLTGPRDAAPDVAVTLAVDEGRFRLATGEEVDGYTLNGTSPGPEVRARQGDLVEVTLVNEGVADGATLHWHGVDVPNAEDGVAGVTQDAVPVGGRHVYRFVAEDAGTYWYHSHQVSHEQVKGGLFGTLVVEPSDGVVDDVVAAVHSYDGLRTVSGRTGEWHVAAEPGSTRRIRLVNTDNGPLRAWVVGAPFRVVAVDGVDLAGAAEVEDRQLVLTAGGRYDLEVTVPQDGVRLELGGGAALVLGPDGDGPGRADAPPQELDLLSYGTPTPLPFDAGSADRSFDYDIGRRPGFVDGRPGFWWTVNGRLFPDVPMYVVAEGDVVRMTIRNDSGDVHPMHLHGHHAVVLSRNGTPASGSPWWVDSLNVKDGERYEIAFLADNPGVWMDHCHNLPHAAEGLVAHLMYAGVDTPYRVGGGPERAENSPE
jgi:FtsP/CotA-like multicopper oxidase with cupredoxin domain